MQYHNALQSLPSNAQTQTQDYGKYKRLTELQ